DGIDWYLLHLPGPAPAHRQHMRTTETEPQLDKGHDERIEHARRHSVRLQIVCHGCSFLSTVLHPPQATHGMPSCTRRPLPSTLEYGAALRLSLQQSEYPSPPSPRTRVAWAVFPFASAYAPTVLYWNASPTYGETTMQLNGLPADLAQFVDDALARGTYQSTEDLVCKALQVLQQQDTARGTPPLSATTEVPPPPQSPEDY